ncbi:MAG: hemolysin XhlA family protein [Sarcina sp.]
MNEELVTHEIEIHEKRLNSHSERLDKIEQAQAEFKIHIQSLCEDIKNLTGALKWLCGLLGTSFIGFFFYMIQHYIVK